MTVVLCSSMYSDRVDHMTDEVHHVNNRIQVQTKQWLLFWLFVCYFAFCRLVHVYNCFHWKYPSPNIRWNRHLRFLGSSRHDHIYLVNHAKGMWLIHTCAMAYVCYLQVWNDLFTCVPWRFLGISDKHRFLCVSHTVQIHIYSVNHGKGVRDIRTKNSCQQHRFLGVSDKHRFLSVSHIVQIHSYLVNHENKFVRYERRSSWDTNEDLMTYAGAMPHCAATLLQHRFLGISDSTDSSVDLTQYQIEFGTNFATLNLHSEKRGIWGFRCSEYLVNFQCWEARNLRFPL